MIQNAVICDIDGTIADCEHRRHWVLQKPKRFDKFFEEMIKDTVKPNIRDLIARLSEHNSIIFVTGRPEAYRKTTEEWLRAHGLHYMQGYTKLLMRPDDSFESDVLIKHTIYNRDIKPFYNVKFVLDDRTCVVNMWRELGLECWQVANGDF